jgi:hypothetical protein
MGSEVQGFGVPRFKSSGLSIVAVRRSGLFKQRRDSNCGISYELSAIIPLFHVDGIKPVSLKAT